MDMKIFYILLDVLSLIIPDDITTVFIHEFVRPEVLRQNPFRKHMVIYAPRAIIATSGHLNQTNAPLEHIVPHLGPRIYRTVWTVLPGLFAKAMETKKFLVLRINNLFFSNLA